MAGSAADLQTPLVVRADGQCIEKNSNVDPRNEVKIRDMIDGEREQELRYLGEALQQGLAMEAEVEERVLKGRRGVAGAFRRALKGKNVSQSGVEAQHPLLRAGERWACGCRRPTIQRQHMKWILCEEGVEPRGREMRKLQGGMALWRALLMEREMLYGGETGQPGPETAPGRWSQGKVPARGRYRRGGTAGKVPQGRYPKEGTLREVPQERYLRGGTLRKVPQGRYAHAH